MSSRMHELAVEIDSVLRASARKAANQSTLPFGWIGLRQRAKLRRDTASDAMRHNGRGALSQLIVRGRGRVPSGQFTYERKMF